jgi:hypothetical protein
VVTVAECAVGKFDRARGVGLSYPFNESKQIEVFGYAAVVSECPNCFIEGGC